jgi:hypothetical protein
MKFPPWRRREEELEEEIQSHLRMAIRDRMQRGESAGEAESAARREFGNVGLIKETTRVIRRWCWRDTRAGAITLAVTPVGRRKRGGSGDVSHGSIVADSDRGVRLLDSGAARGEG